MRLGLRPDPRRLPSQGPISMPVDPAWLARLRGRRRAAHGCAGRAPGAAGRPARREGRRLAECERRSPGTETELHIAMATSAVPAQRCGIAERPAAILLKRGDRFRLARATGSSKARRRDRTGRVPRHRLHVAGGVRAGSQGERIWFDDGRIGGIVVGADENVLDVEITDVRPGGEKLLEDKGINLPDSDLRTGALTDQDLVDLGVAARCADIVGLSFVQTADDVERCAPPDRTRGRQLGIVLKIETRRGFENLPELLFAALPAPPSA